MTRFCPRLLIASIFLFSACASAPARVVSQPETAWLLELESPRPIGPNLAAGFERQRTRGGVLETGDRVLFELMFERDEEVTYHYLTFEVLGPDMQGGSRRYFELTGEVLKQKGEGGEAQTASLDGRSPGHRIGVKLFDAKGEALKESEVSLAEFVGLGQVTACELLSGLDEEELANGEFSSEWMDEFMQSLRSLVSLIGLAQGDDLLSDLMWDVIDKPSIFSVLSSLGVTVNVTPRHDLAIQLNGDVEGLDVPGPLWIFPMSFSINGQAALHLDLAVANPSPPWAMTSGIVAFRGQHPTKSVNVRARLVGASSGP